MVSSYLKYSTTATKPCTQSASSTPAVWLHGLSLHICGTVDFTCVQTLRVACVRPRMYTEQSSRLRTVTDSKATPSRTILWGSVKPHAKNFLYASSHANTEVRMQMKSTVLVQGVATKFNGDLKSRRICYCVCCILSLMHFC